MSGFKIVAGRVGEGGLKQSMSVRRLQQLLMENEYDLEPYGADGDWGNVTRSALNDWQDKNGCPIRNFVEPEDECLFQLALQAGVLLHVPSGTKGAAGFKQVHDYLESEP